MVAELDLTDQDVTTIADMIDTEIQAHVPEWVRADGLNDDPDSKIGGSDIHGPKAEDELRSIPNEQDNSPGALVLEKLPSGRKYWSDSPKGSCGNSPPGLTQSNQPSDLNAYASDDFSSEVSEKLEDPLKLNEQIATGSSVGNQECVASSASLESVRASNTEETYDSNLAHSQKEETTAKHDIIYKCSDTTLVASEREALKLVHKLEELLMEQQNELDELKRTHSMAIAQLLQTVPPELRVRIRNMSRMKLPGYSIDGSDVK